MKPSDFKDMTLFENIQIRLDEQTFAILKSDTEFYGFRGLNALLNHIVTTYATDYAAAYHARYNQVIDILKQHHIIDSIQSIIAHELIASEIKSTVMSSKKSKAVKIHLNQANETDFLYLVQETLLLQPLIGFPEIIRDLIIRYTKQSRVQREIILYREVYLDILAALKRNVQVVLYLENNQVIQIHPYAIIHPLDEEGNYLMGEDDDYKIEAFPLFRIKKLVLKTIPAHHSSQIVALHQEIISTSFNYQQLAILSSNNILEKVQMLKNLTHYLSK